MENLAELENKLFQGILPRIEEKILKELDKKFEESLEGKIRELFERRLRINLERLNEITLLERIIRVEEELKALREAQNLMLEMMNRRFEDVNKV